MPSGGVKVFVQRHYLSVSSHPLNLLTAQGDKGSIRDLERDQTERSSHGLHAKFCLWGMENSTIEQRSPGPIFFPPQHSQPNTW
jgi:hypothetical protein